MRYVIAFVATVLITTAIRLATGMDIDVANAAFLGFAVCAGTYLGTRGKGGLSSMSGKKGLTYMVLALLLATTMLIAEAYRIYGLVESGRLLVSTNPIWFVSWSDRPIGFIVAIAMHLFIVVFSSVIAFVSVAEIKQRYDSRRGSVEY